MGIDPVGKPSWISGAQNPLAFELQLYAVIECFATGFLVLRLFPNQNLGYLAYHSDRQFDISTGFRLGLPPNRIKVERSQPEKRSIPHLGIQGCKTLHAFQEPSDVERPCI